MLGLVVGLDMDRDQRVGDFRLDRAFQPVADVMRFGDAHRALHYQMKINEGHAAGMTGEVDVLGQAEYLEIWNHDRFLSKLHREPFTDDDARALAEHGI